MAKAKEETKKETKTETKKETLSGKEAANTADAKKELIKLGYGIIDDINKGKNPHIELSVRGLSNVVYDKESKTIGLGDKTAQRFFFNVAHSKKFLQTIEIASICKNLLDVTKHASLRDVFYMAKRTIPNTKINVVDEQTESDKSIEDLELITGYSRENLNVNANKMDIFLFF